MTMKKIMNWVLAATLVCGASTFTSCSDNDNPAQEQAKKNRKEFVSHTRSVLKDLAENLNFTSWTLANTINVNFNEYWLNNDAFEKTITRMFIQQCNESLKPVEEGSELAQMGYQYQAAIDLSQMKYRFTMNAEGTGWDIEPADAFELILTGWNPETWQKEQVYKLTIKFSGDTFLQLNHGLSQLTNAAVVMKMPTDVSFAFATKISGEWVDSYSGQFKNQFEKRTESNLYSIITDAWNITGTVKSTISDRFAGYGLKADATTLDFAIGQDPKTHQSGLLFNFVHNDKSRVALRAVGTNQNGLTDLSFLAGSSSILDIIAAVAQGNSVDDLTLTLNDDLTTTVKVTDCGKALEAYQAAAKACRNYADQQTIDQYTQQLNQLVSGTITCKGVNQQIPMRLTTTQLGVDYLPMIALNFADENGYTPLTELLDAESIAYGINIIDHAAKPMSQSIITVRQLVQFFNSLMGANVQSEGGLGGGKK